MLSPPSRDGLQLGGRSPGPSGLILAHGADMGDWNQSRAGMGRGDLNLAHGLTLYHLFGPQSQNCEHDWIKPIATQSTWKHENCQKNLPGCLSFTLSFRKWIIITSKITMKKLESLKKKSIQYPSQKMSSPILKMHCKYYKFLIILNCGKEGKGMQH